MGNENNENASVQTEKAAMPNKNMKLCKTCGAAIAKNAKRCPTCGAKNKKPIFKRVWFWFLCVIAIFVIVLCVDHAIAPSYPATITDDYGVTTEMLPSQIRAAYAENFQSASDRLGLAKAEITTKVVSVGNGKYETVDNKRFLYIDVELEGGWVLDLLKEPNEDLLKGLKKGDTIHINSRITYDNFLQEVHFRDFLINGNTITDRTVVTVVTP